MRKKLIELLSIPTCPSAICNFCRHFKSKAGCEKQKKEQIADHLIANGVTIPVRCKDCRWRKNGSLCYMISGCGVPTGTGDDFFCSYGERKDNAP